MIVIIVENCQLELVTNVIKCKSSTFHVLYKCYTADDNESVKAYVYNATSIYIDIDNNFHVLIIKTTVRHIKGQGYSVYLLKSSLVMI
jgi:hypothetical protein